MAFYCIQSPNKRWQNLFREIYLSSLCRSTFFGDRHSFPVEAFRGSGLHISIVLVILHVQVATVRSEARKEQLLAREQAKACERQERFAFRELLDESALAGVFHSRSSWSTVLLFSQSGFKKRILSLFVSNVSFYLYVPNFFNKTQVIFLFE